MSNAPSASSSDTTSSLLGALARWGPVVAWAGCIWWFSSDAFSARSTHRHIDPVLRWLFGDLTPAGFRLAHAVIRKTAHVVEYGMLALLLCRALTAPGARRTAAPFLRAVLYCAAFASADELHQFFETNRTGAASDVVIDTAGAPTGATLFRWYRASVRRRAGPRESLHK